MGRLYSQASVVRAWLVPEGDAKLAFDYMHRCPKPFSRPDKEMIWELMRTKLDPERWWVIQEVVLASNVIG
jgi:hypothetical protein